jgi:hypothetical protein
MRCKLGSAFEPARRAVASTERTNDPMEDVRRWLVAWPLHECALGSHSRVSMFIAQLVRSFR